MDTGHVPTPTLLEKHPLLLHLAPEQLQRMARAGEIESYNPASRSSRKAASATRCS